MEQLADLFDEDPGAKVKRQLKSKTGRWIVANS
jgi:hypothetical protein